MTAFVILCALFISGALLFVLPPLLQGSGRAGAPRREDLMASIYRDEFAELDADLANGVISHEQHAQAREELQRRLLEDATGAAPAAGPGGGKPAAIAAGVALPLLAALLYWSVGSPEAISLAPAPAAPGGHATGQITPQQIEAMVQALAARLDKNPNDADGWEMLGRSYTNLGRFPEAAKALGRAAQLSPRNAQLLADYADVLAMAQGRRLAGEPAAIIGQALAADPQHPKALALAGSAAFEAKDYKGAVAYWERLLALLPPESPTYRSVAGGVAEARALGGTAPAGAKAAGAKSPGMVSGEVSLSPALAAKVAPGDTVFVFARATQGPRMPVAILRLAAKDLPAKFTLDDSQAMSPDMKLSGFGEVVVGARVSKSGDATPKSGDLEGLTAPVKVGSRGLRVVIDRALP